MAETDDERARPHRWESWDRIGEGHAKLARYVAPAALRGLRLAGSHDEQGPVELVAEQLFERLRAVGIKPAPEPHVSRRGLQVIHDARLLLQDGVGTCLDLATTYAAMLAEAQIGTLLAVTDDHAFVVVTPGRLQEERFPRAAIEIGGFAQDPDEETGVLLGEAGALVGALDMGTAIAVDAVQALAGYGDYAEATAAARRLAASERLRLVDVPYLHGDKDRRFEPFDPTVNRPAIHPYVPEDDTPFFEYPGHRETIARLREERGIVVLLGESGSGKSRIARELARDAPLGAGWFLDASEARVLMKSYADADRNERQEPFEQAAGRARLDREGYAESALAQLGRVADRWIVVLDNADGDPGQLERLMPGPGRDQLVLVTSTNPDWRAVPSVRVIELPPLAASDVEAAAGGDPDVAALTELIAGRPLMLRAFQSLLRATGTDGAGIAARAPSAAEAGREELRGPAALWAALRAAPGFGEVQLCASACAAHLPPDHQPIAVCEALAPGSAAAVRTLVDHGLLTYELDAGPSADERAAVRMHRLFGAVARADLDATEPALCDEVARRIAGESASRTLLDVRGDLDTVRRLEARLLAQDRAEIPPDAELGRALHGLAWLLELHGQTRDSGGAYERAQRHLEAAGLRVLVADCLHGRARIVNQHDQRDPPRLREAVAWAREARRILLEEPGEEANADRCLAMEGLLLQKLAAFPGPGQTTLGLLEDALALIEQADENRRSRPEDTRVDEAELARSMFNRAGVRIRLAREQPQRAAEHLDLAQRVYEDVRATRVRIYRRELHPHIAACIAGLAYVAYYRAMLIPASARMRSTWLRLATDRMYESIKQREALEGPIDLDEATKNARFLAKVALARMASPVAAAAAPRAAAQEAIGEMTRAGIAYEPVAPLPAGRRDLPDAIEAWARSRPLTTLVGQFGDVAPGGRPEQPPADASVVELLAWLHDFSGRHWDFREGRERNLAPVPRFAPEARVVALRAAEALGLMGGTRPPSGRYEHVLILGGLVRGCLARPLHAAELLREGAITAGAVTALGGFREIGGDEHGLVERVLGEEVDDELHAMDAGVRNAFGVEVPVSDRGEDREAVGASWRVREYRTDDGQLLQVVAAPSTRPGRRANTPDTYAWFATELAKLQPGERVLVVTTQIYAPYQHADALRMLALPYGVEVDVTGVVPGDVDPRLRQPFGPDKYLQEIRSTIRALRDLYEAL